MVFLKFVLLKLNPNLRLIGASGYFSTYNFFLERNYSISLKKITTFKCLLIITFF